MEKVKGCLKIDQETVLFHETSQRMVGMWWSELMTTPATDYRQIFLEHRPLRTN